MSDSMNDATPKRYAEEEPQKSLPEVFAFYDEALGKIYDDRTAGEYTWLGILHEFFREATGIDL